MNYSFLADNVWGSSGRQSGPAKWNEDNSKYKYKLAIGDATNQFEDGFNDDLLDSYMLKYFKNFWHSWKHHLWRTSSLTIFPNFLNPNSSRYYCGLPPQIW